VSKVRDQRKVNARRAAYRTAFGPCCPACGERESHYVVPSLGEAGFYICATRSGRGTS
jgi:hypothetical protein